MKLILDVGVTIGSIWVGARYGFAYGVVAYFASFVVIAFLVAIVVAETMDENK